jgi:ABC-type multidrug transport system ATPase subunit
MKNNMAHSGSHNTDLNSSDVFPCEGDRNRVPGHADIAPHRDQASLHEDVAIECIDLNKNFGKRTALQSISLRVGQGMVTAVVGSNGSGKTTLLRILATLLLPSGGTARVLGRDVQREPLLIKRRIGYVSSEERSFYWRLTSRQNLHFFAGLHGISELERGRRIDALLKAVGLEEIADVAVRECSSGMKQVLGLIRGMLHDPPVLLLDEPTRSLAPDIAKRVQHMIRQAAEADRKTVLIASHNLIEVEHIADEIIILHRGVIQASGTLAQLCLSAGISQGGSLDQVFQHYIEKPEASL